MHRAEIRRFLLLYKDDVFIYAITYAKYREALRRSV